MVRGSFNIGLIDKIDNVAKIIMSIQYLVCENTSSFFREDFKDNKLIEFSRKCTLKTRTRRKKFRYIGHKMH